MRVAIVMLCSISTSSMTSRVLTMTTKSILSKLWVPICWNHFCLKQFRLFAPPFSYAFPRCQHLKAFYSRNFTLNSKCFYKGKCDFQPVDGTTIFITLFLKLTARFSWKLFLGFSQTAQPNRAVRGLSCLLKWFERPWTSRFSFSVRSTSLLAFTLRIVNPSTTRAFSSLSSWRCWSFSVFAFAIVLFLPNLREDENSLKPAFTGKCFSNPSL